MTQKNILLAEDDPGHEAMLSRAIERSRIPCRVDVVHDGAEAVDFLLRAGEYKSRGEDREPDLMLLDLKMPKMTGLQVLQVLRRVRGDERNWLPPVVVLSCSDDDEDIARAYDLGAQSYISKPLDYKEFVRAVDDTLEYWLGLNRPAPRRRLPRLPLSANAGGSLAPGAGERP